MVVCCQHFETFVPCKQIFGTSAMFVTYVMLSTGWHHPQHVTSLQIVSRLKIWIFLSNTFFIHCTVLSHIFMLKNIHTEVLWKPVKFDIFETWAITVVVSCLSSVVLTIIPIQGYKTFPTKKMDFPLLNWDYLKVAVLGESYHPCLCCPFPDRVPQPLCEVKGHISLMNSKHLLHKPFFRL